MFNSLPTMTEWIRCGTIFMSNIFHLGSTVSKKFVRDHWDHRPWSCYVVKCSSTQSCEPMILTNDLMLQAASSSHNSVVVCKVRAIKYSIMVNNMLWEREEKKDRDLSWCLEFLWWYSVSNDFFKNNNLSLRAFSVWCLWLKHIS